MARRPQRHKTPTSQQEHEEDDALDQEGFEQEEEQQDEGQEQDDLDQGQDEGQEDDPVSERLEALERQNQDLMDELRQLRRPMVDQTKPPASPEEPINWEERFFTDTSGAVQQVMAKVKEEIRQEYAQEQVRQQFWTDFYKGAKDLEGDHDLVLTTMNANMAKLGPLSAPEARKLLAQLTRDRIKRYKGKPVDTRGGRRPNVADASGERPSTLERQPEAGPKTLSDILAKRRTARRRSLVI